MKTKKTLGLAGNFMDIDESIYALEELEKQLGYSSQAIFIAIKYLKKLKKYEAMFGEIKEIFEHNHMTYVDRDLWNELEQKYFPEPVKKIITIEFESHNKDAIKSNINLLRAHLERVRDIPPKIKYTIKEGD